ncbi:MAG: hypothetical protein C5B56_14400 [Proteobacteria bacterium]|nr:MAG: hypothetical protein C5B56_14400 [Pseudomonadota bacterium]
MLDGVILLWFVLAAMAVLFVAIDIRTTPESPVLKWGFVLVTAYTGVFGAFLYVLGCREPLPGLHEQYASARWRQALGSTMHCVAGDGVGIIVGAVLAGALHIGGWWEVALEYVLGFGFGWTIFQALFMRDMVGGSYVRSLTSTFIPELLSMNLLMAGMVPTMMILKMHLGGGSPGSPVFWFVMSMALLVGSILAYPMNWWLVSYHLKHGMLTVRPIAATAHLAHAQAAPAGRLPSEVQEMDMPGMDMGQKPAPQPPVPAMTLLSFVALAVGLAIAWLTGSM